MRKNKKGVRKRQNIFKGSNPDDFRVTNHFLERWNERVGSPYFHNKDELLEYLRCICKKRKPVHISEDCYQIQDLLVTTTAENNKILFITTYGTYRDNPMLYNLLLTEGVKGVRTAHKKYGKLQLNYAC